MNENKFSVTVLVSLILLFLLSGVNAQTFPSRLLNEIPEASAILSSTDVRERASILKKIVVPVPQSCTLEQSLPFALERQDYEFIVSKILELDLSGLDYKEDSWIWGNIEYLITRFEMHGQLETMTKYLGHSERFVRAGIVDAVRRLKATQFDGKIAPLLGDPDNFVRNETLQALIEIGSKKAIPALISSLSDPNHLTRYSALMNLVKVNGVEAAPEISKLLYDEHEDIRFWAIDTLVKVSAKSEAPKLWKFMETETNPRFKGYALAALLYFGDKKAVPIALKFFKDSALGEVSSYSGEFIGQLKPKILIPELIALYHQKERFFESDEQESRMRAGIYNALYNYRTPEAKAIYRENLFGEDSYNRGKKSFNEGVVQILIEIGATEAVDDIIVGLQEEIRKDRNSEYYDQRVGMIAYYLAKFGDKKANKILLDVAAENNSRYRGMIVAEMNKQLNPALWKKLESQIMVLTPIESIQTFVEKATLQSGVKITFEKQPASEKLLCTTDDFSLKNGIPCAYSDGRMSVRQSLDHIFSDQRNKTYTWIFDGEKVRVLSIENAVEWWRKNILIKN
jgi:HEAT repeat protein